MLCSSRWNCFGKFENSEGNLDTRSWATYFTYLLFRIDGDID